MRLLVQLGLASAVLATGWHEPALAVAFGPATVEVAPQLLAPAPDLKPAPPPNRRPPTRKRHRKKNRARLARLEDLHQQTAGVSGAHAARALRSPSLDRRVEG